MASEKEQGKEQSVQSNYTCFIKSKDLISWLQPSNPTILYSKLEIFVNPAVHNPKQTTNSRAESCNLQIRILLSIELGPTQMVAIGMVSSGSFPCSRSLLSSLDSGPGFQLWGYLESYA